MSGVRHAYLVLVLEDFGAFVEWVLVNNGSACTICHEEDVTSPTPDPEPSQHGVNA